MPKIKICSKLKGFRRCGIAHEDQWKEYPVDRFTLEEIDRLVHEPLLAVQFIDEPAPPEPEPQPEPEPEPADAPKSTKKGK